MKYIMKQKEVDAFQWKGDIVAAIHFFQPFGFIASVSPGGLTIKGERKIFVRNGFYVVMDNGKILVYDADKFNELFIKKGESSC